MFVLQPNFNSLFFRHQTVIMKSYSLWSQWTRQILFLPREETLKKNMAIRDFDDILPHVGSFGPFQKRILLLSLPINYFLAVVYMAQIYQTLTPEHWCNVPELAYLDQDQRRNISIPKEERDGQLVFSRCKMFDVNFTRVSRCCYLTIKYAFIQFNKIM